MKESGKGVGENAFGCEGHVDSCQKIIAEAHGRPIDGGSLVMKYGFHQDERFTNPRNVDCVDVVGEGTFRKGSNKIFISFEGPFCESLGAYMKVHYNVTGGDGRFDGAKGRGGLFVRFQDDITYQSGGTLKF